jgi:DNA invertase Pin-like site-specific DNA recombinase
MLEISKNARVAIFARVSTKDHQEFNRQVSDLTRVILIEGYANEQIDVFAEKISGYSEKSERHELARLFKTIKDTPKIYDAVYVTEVSRLGRNPRITKDIIEELCDLQVQLKISNPNVSTLEPNGLRNNFTQIMLSIAIEFSDIEAKRMKVNMKSGKIQRAIEGKLASNMAAFGYMSKDGYLVKNPDEANHVENIFNLYKSGKGTLVIAKTLNELKVRTKFQRYYDNKILNYKDTNTELSTNDIKWSDVTVRQILINPVYIGKPKIKIKDAVTEIIDGKKVNISPAEYTTTINKIEPIISEEIFNECNELLKTKSTRNYLTKNEYLLKDLIICGCCGKKYVGKYTKKKDKVYKCTSYLPSGTSCGNRSINISLIESVIFDIVSNSESLLKYLDNPNDIIKQIETELVDQKQLLKNESKALIDKEKQADNLIIMRSTSSKPNSDRYLKLEVEIDTAIETINKRIKLLEKDIYLKQSSILNYDTVTATKEMFENAKRNRPELKMIIKQFIYKIIINELDKDYILATLFIKINGLELPTTLKLFIYTTGIRIYGGRNEKKYMYLAKNGIENDPVYKNNILMVDKEDIANEFHSLIYYKDGLGILPITEMKTILPENYIYILETDI